MTRECNFRWLLSGAIFYLIIFFLAAPLFLYFIQKYFSSPLLVITLAQTGLTLTLAFFLSFFCIIQKKETLQMIWKSSQKSSYFADILFGILGWVISFPIVSFIHHFSEKINHLLFNIQSREQVAVGYLRFVAKSPGPLTIALISILLFAPLIEECIFRGFLQTYLKQRLKFKWALLLSSFIFAIFHLSFSQGMQNFPLLLSLFSLSLFLGFLYEKQHSLLSPITLHMTFNLITVIRILLLKD